jgi:hypothetical protein
MPKRTIILITLLTILTAALVMLAIRNEQNRQPVEESPRDSISQETDVVKNAEMMFEPSAVVISSGSAQSTVMVVIDTKDRSADGVQLELVYDPQALSNVTVTLPDNNFFGTASDAAVIVNSIDQERGRISYWVGVNPDALPSEGIGAIAEISFIMNPVAPVNNTVIEIMDQSMITDGSLHTNILGKTSQLQIMRTQ